MTQSQEKSCRTNATNRRLISFNVCPRVLLDVSISNNSYTKQQLFHSASCVLLSSRPDSLFLPASINPICVVDHYMRGVSHQELSRCIYVEFCQSVSYPLDSVVTKLVCIISTRGRIRHLNSMTMIFILISIVWFDTPSMLFALGAYKLFRTGSIFSSHQISTLQQLSQYQFHRT